MGLGGKIKIGAALLAILSVAGLGLHAAGLRNDRDRLSRELQSARLESAGLNAELAAGRRALQDREAESQRLAGEYAALAAKLEEVYGNDSEARAWADALCPVAVLDGLRR